MGLNGRCKAQRDRSRGTAKSGETVPTGEAGSKKKEYQLEKPISISVVPIEYYDGDPLIRIRLMPSSSSTVIAIRLELQGKGALSGSYTANQSAIIHPFFNRGPLARSVGRL